MSIVITGGAGFLGGLVTEALLERGGEEELVSLDLAPSAHTSPRVRSVVGDLADQGVLEEAVGPETTAIIHLAAVLSGGSEDDFDLSMHVNVDGTRALLERARTVSAGADAPLRFVATSSLAVFGGEVPSVVPSSWATQPDSTYGALKAVVELLVNEYSRKGFVDGRVCRLPTISVRPGRPNSAASSFASGIIREPLQGVESVCPVPHDTLMWLSAPRTAVTNLLHALDLPPEDLGSWRVMNIPGLTVSVGEMLETLGRVGGDVARSLVRDEPDARITAIVGSWPGAFEVDDLLERGFVRDESFAQMVQEYVEDHLAAP
ncbi:NAD-dependent epimerase [Brachybacterium endophyticum]|uniref:NAD-dependent epimerase n=1 Tax=Brachybacterium endophyticum TaxID=2182385 RepID=A0A2U2RML8_9MICO|nr:D-erythronate dehydrogenase [Brachybacterium endophyticum]PWH07120.1 NAD-dependent epimerase [Brachybacterium endophyticum]